MCSMTLLGEPLFARRPDGRPVSNIVTVFPRYDALVTLAMPHAFQIEAFLQYQQRQGSTPLTPDEEQEIREDAVAAVIEGDVVQIRPDPQNMPLAFRADKLLQKQGVSKRRIGFLNVFNPQVRTALKRRGECWRIARLPTSRTEMKERILAAKTTLPGAAGEALYYYNSTTGTRWLTCQEFSRLGELDDELLRRNLDEIRRFSARLNPNHRPEVAFYLADSSFTAESFAPCEFLAMGGQQLRGVYENLKDRFRQAVPAESHDDDLESGSWRHRMFSSLVSEDNELVSEEVLLSLSAEFYMQIRWLPGGRIVNGELAFDELFEEEDQDPGEEKAHEFLYNLVRQYEDLEYVNIGEVVNSLSRRSWAGGRREVYIAVLKRHSLPMETVSILRMQKWGVREHLNANVSLHAAHYLSDEYTEYILDRRFACRYLEMNIPKRVTARKICERVTAPWAPAQGYMIWSPYFERPYIPGIATDKLPRQRLRDPAYALAFARLLGEAAASNLIVGRCDGNKAVLFDDGDEVVVEKKGLPIEIVIADQTGTFADFANQLKDLTPAYAEPVNKRVEQVPDPEAFARAYLEGFVEHFQSVQDKYRSRRRAFDALFKTRPYDEQGCFAYHWKMVLKRLDQSDPHELAALIEARFRIGVGCK